jgi:triosephosphate isomerase
MRRKPTIIGNWKMNGSISETKALLNELIPLVKDVNKVEIGVCPAFTSLSFTAETLKGSNINYGAQNFYFEEKGAFTGEVSAKMLLELGCKYVIIGHSERRNIFGETDDLVNRKLKAALKSKLVPIVCVGEKLNEREQKLTDKIIIGQLEKGFNKIDSPDFYQIIIAYEPVWAIGTGKVCPADEANRVIELIRKKIAEIFSESSADQLRILYGGSVTPQSIAEQMAKPEIDGALVGGASLKETDFARIVKFQAGL